MGKSIYVFVCFEDLMVWNMDELKFIGKCTYNNNFKKIKNKFEIFSSIDLDLLRKGGISVDLTLLRIDIMFGV